MARTNAETNSLRNTERAAWSKLILAYLPCDLDASLPPLSSAADPVPDQLSDTPEERDVERQNATPRQDNLPSQPHELIIAIARDERVRHGEQEEYERRLEGEPDRPRHPGEGRNRKRRQPSAQE